MIADAGDRGERGVAFVLGGPFGHGEEAQKRAHKLLRLSDLVLNHEVARLVIVEALYRYARLNATQSLSHRARLPRATQSRSRQPECARARWRPHRH